jgi:ribonuclease Z
VEQQTTAIYKNFKISGHSRSAERTCFLINNEICLDAGIATQKNVKIILLTHSHPDHSDKLSYIYRPQMKIFCPHSSVQVIRKFLESMQCLLHNTTNLNEDQRFISDQSVCGLLPNQFFKLKDGLYAKSVLLDHSVTTYGYILYSLHHRLKSQYQNLTKNMLQWLKSQNVEITESYFSPLLSYLTDTSIHGFRSVMTNGAPSNLIFVECTFLTNDPTFDVDNKKHIDWPRLSDEIKLYPQISFVLIHFSTRYTDQEIIDFFKNFKYSCAFPNVYLWLDLGVYCVKDNNFVSKID